MTRWTHQTLIDWPKRGVTYTNVYSTSGVCAPSRAAITLGMYPSAVGANHMRTSSNTQDTGLPAYEAVPPAHAKILSQYLREAGYYTTNNVKTDYQFLPPKAAWNESSVFAHWRNRPAGQPFYAVFNFTTTHESGLFEPYGIRHIESRHYFSDDAARIAQLPQHHAQKTSVIDTPIHLPIDTVFKVPPYLPDTPEVQYDLWKMYNNLVETDRQIGAIIQQLIDDNLYDSTIVVFYSDHGGPLPRQKRLIYDSGLQVPFIIRFPNARRGGSTDDQLISFVDFAPTTLGMAGIDAPPHMHGQDFLAIDTEKREYIHAAADRFDGFTDVIRAVKNERFKYIRNYRPEQGYYLPVVYRERIPTMQALLRLRDSNGLTPEQAQWFRTSKPVEELFDTHNDPHELVNLAGEERYQDELRQLRLEMDRWLADIGDVPNTAEVDLINALWGGQPEKPTTATPEFSTMNNKFVLSSDTEGAVISYQLSSDDSAQWHLYTGPFLVPSKTSVTAVAHRLGFNESPSVVVKN
ncbi:sulfatase-like hydrolase/transferase [Alteromonas sp. KUL49]|uniref:sulfatase-like hydrolase/transferase n=1 Tax=Alteromonas sp. KUL49 TaxID=2480798 RepID=UPI001F5EC2B8|nr:sulfatase-like hydrolase/transferase [Alteromonas sp. KUL49]